MFNSISRRESDSRGALHSNRGSISPKTAGGGRDTLMGFNRSVTPVIHIPTAKKERGTSQCGEDLDAIVEKKSGNGIRQSLAAQATVKPFMTQDEQNLSEVDSNNNSEQCV